MKTDFLLRNVESQDWASVLFIFALGIIAYNKWMFSAQFSDFSKLLYSKKYITMYKDETNLKNWFTLSMAGVQFLTLSFLIHLVLSSISDKSPNDFVHFLQILNGLSFFVIAKYCIEKIVAICFDIDTFLDKYNLTKVNYRNYAATLLLPIIMILFYNTTIVTESLLALAIAIVIGINILIYIVVIKNFQKHITPYLYYFILYLCTFEIAPYYILYKWYINSGI